MSILPPLNITFGIEIECVVKCSLEQLQNLRGSDGGYQLNDVSNQEVIFRTIERLLIAGGISIYAINAGYATNWECWTLTTDCSIDCIDQNEDLYYCAGLEIVSRVMKPSQESFEEIKQVLYIIQSSFQMIVNSSTGLHVHVGNGVSGFPLSTVRKFAIFVVAFEHLIHSLHPSSRVAEDSSASNWCQRCSFSSQLQHLNPYHRILAIQQQQLIDDVTDMLNAGIAKRFAYCLRNLKVSNGENTTKRTIEFRQHAGSTDAEQIINWVTFATGLVNFCHEVSDCDHALLWMSNWRNLSFTLIDLIKTIGREDLVSYYGSRMFSHPISSSHLETI